MCMCTVLPLVVDVFQAASFFLQGWTRIPSILGLLLNASYADPVGRFALQGTATPGTPLANCAGLGWTLLCVTIAAIPYEFAGFVTEAGPKDPVHPPVCATAGRVSAFTALCRAPSFSQIGQPQESSQQHQTASLNVQSTHV